MNVQIKLTVGSDTAGTFSEDLTPGLEGYTMIIKDKDGNVPVEIYGFVSGTLKIEHTKSRPNAVCSFLFQRYRMNDIIVKAYVFYMYTFRKNIDAFKVGNACADTFEISLFYCPYFKKA